MLLKGSFAPAGLDVGARKQEVLACAMPAVREVEEGTAEEEEGMNYLGEAHDRVAQKERALAARDSDAPSEDTPADGDGERTGDAPESKAAAGDLSQYWGSQIAFNQILALGAIQKSGSVYVQANGYTQGASPTEITSFTESTESAWLS